MQTRSVVEEQALDKNCVQLLRRCLQKFIMIIICMRLPWGKTIFDDNRSMLLLIRMIMPLYKFSE